MLQIACNVLHLYLAIQGQFCIERQKTERKKTSVSAYRGSNLKNSLHRVQFIKII